MISENEFPALLQMLEEAGADPEMSIEETFLGDAALYFECLEKLREDSNIGELEKSISSGNRESTIRAVHTLKGIADNLALFPLVDAAVAVLRPLRAGKWEGIAPLIDKLKEEYEVFSKIQKLSQKISKIDGRGFTKTNLYGLVFFWTDPPNYHPALTAGAFGQRCRINGESDGMPCRH